MNFNPPTPTNRAPTAAGSNYYFLPKNGSFKINRSGSATEQDNDKAIGPIASRPNRTLSMSRDSSLNRRPSMNNSGSNLVRTAPEVIQQSWWSSIVTAVIGKPTIRSDSKVEPKIFLSNERTFLAWLDMAVTLAAISVAVLSMSEHAEGSLLYGLILLPISIAFCVYALSLYLARNNRLRRKLGGDYNFDKGPIAMTVILCVAIFIYFSCTLFELMEHHNLDLD